MKNNKRDCSRLWTVFFICCFILVFISLRYTKRVIVVVIFKLRIILTSDFSNNLDKFYAISLD